MKTRSLFLVALLSLLSLSAFADDNACVFTYAGTANANMIGSTEPTEVTLGDDILVKGTYTNPSAVKSVTVRLLNGWSVVEGVSTTYTVKADGTLDSIFHIPEDAPLSRWPDADSYADLKLQLMVEYDVNKFADATAKIATVPLNGIYPEVTAPAPKVADFMDVKIVVTPAAGGDSVEYAMSSYLLYTVVPGDIVHLTGTYSTSIGDTSKAVSVEGGFVYFNTSWGKTVWQNGGIFASEEQENVDGVIDIKMVAPYFKPSKTEYEANSYHGIFQIRVNYDVIPTLEYLDGNMGTNNTYVNWTNPIGEATTSPNLGAEVTGITATGVTENTVSLSWDLGADAAWDVVIATAGARITPSAEEYTTVYGIEAVIGGLASGTEYDVYMRSVSNTDSVARRTGTYAKMDDTFTTLGDAAGIFTPSAAKTVNLYPNPTAGKLTITANETYAIEVCDLSGRSLMQSSMTSLTTELDLTDMTNGIYLVRFSNGSESFAKTFIKQ